MIKFGSSLKELIQMKGTRFRGFKGSSEMFKGLIAAGCLSLSATLGPLDP